MQIYWTKIKEVVAENIDTKTYYLECPEGFVWEEGAHTHLALEGFNSGDKPNRSLVRHMSICTMPDEETIGITTRVRKERSEFKTILDDLPIGSEVALFKTHSNVPLRREDKPVFLLSSGVGIATFRPLVREYLNNADKVDGLHSLNVDSSKNYLYPELFVTNEDGRFTAEFVDNRSEYYGKVKELANQTDSLFYIVGSDEFLADNISLLKEAGVQAENIMLDKHPGRKEEMLNG
ncbi:MAG TPA: dihydropteridine reductase [Aliicoccus persicus]|uniref:Dihydropteridine reductase n=1 Tax=Aliicoccus persicus TaxID=930138 RepID=A0A921DXR4_9STAP|nr:dihydropteridine reductase [Aliicoccus persicus]